MGLNLLRFDPGRITLSLNRIVSPLAELAGLVRSAHRVKLLNMLDPMLQSAITAVLVRGMASFIGFGATVNGAGIRGEDYVHDLTKGDGAPLYRGSTRQ